MAVLGFSGELKDKFLKGGYGHQDRDSHVELKVLPTGEYLFFVEMDWQEGSLEDQHKFEFYGTSYGPGVAEFSDVTSEWTKENIMKTIVK